MTTKYIYLLSTYQEHGSENMRGSFNKAKIVAIMNEDREDALNQIDKFDYEDYYHKMASSLVGSVPTQEEIEVIRAKQKSEMETAFDEYIGEVINLLQKLPSELHDNGNPHEIGKGWGGYQVHVVKVEE